MSSPYHTHFGFRAPRAVRGSALHHFAGSRTLPWPPVALVRGRQGSYVAPLAWRARAASLGGRWGSRVT